MKLLLMPFNSKLRSIKIQPCLGEGVTFTHHRKEQPCSRGTHKVPGELQSSDRRLLCRVYQGNLLFKSHKGRVLPHLRPSAKFKRKVAFLNKSKKTKKQEAFQQENKEIRKKASALKLFPVKAQI